MSVYRGTMRSVLLGATALIVSGGPAAPPNVLLDANFLLGQDDGLAETRASGASRINHAGRLEEVAASVLRYDYDKSLTYNAVPNPWGDGGTIGGAVPTGWSGGGAGCTVTLVGKGTTDDGLPYVDIKLSGTTTNTNPIHINCTTPANRHLGGRAGMAFSGSARVTLIDTTSVPAGATLQATLQEFNDSFAVSGVTTLGTSLALNVEQDVSGTRTASNANMTNGSLTVRMSGHASGAVTNITVRFVAPVLNYGSSPLTNSVGRDVLMARENGVPTYGLKGVRMEPSGTNRHTNPRGEGAVSGSPGTWPTSWGSLTGSGNGITRTITAGITEDGFPCVDLKLAGTATATFNFIATLGQVVLNFGAGSTWRFFANVRRVAGTIPTTTLVLDEYNSGGSWVGDTSGPVTLPTGDTVRKERITGTRVNSSGVNARLDPALVFSLTNGVAYDFTVRFSCPQVTVGSREWDVILPPAGAPAVSTKAQDNLSGTLTEFGASGTAVLDVDFSESSHLSGSGSTVLGFSGSSSGESWELQYNSAADAETIICNLMTCSENTFNDVLTYDDRTVVAWEAGRVALCVNGGAVSEAVPSEALPTQLDEVYVTGSAMFGWVRAVKVLDGALSNTEMQEA